MRVNLLLSLASILIFVSALPLDPTDGEAVHQAAKAVIWNMLKKYYAGWQGGVVGKFNAPVYWWVAGACWGGLIDFWRYTKDDSFTQLIHESITAQMGKGLDFLPIADAKSEGNDDQGFWAFSALSAAESNFPNLDTNETSYIGLAQAVFNQMTTRWEMSTCNGGLRWQIYNFNKGYDYKNTVSNGAFFLIAARLARYTGNQTYVEWANKIFDWTVNVGFLDTSNWIVYDGAKMSTDCKEIEKTRWSYTVALYMAGCAFLANHLNQAEPWMSRTNGLLDQALTVFYNSDKVVNEPSCEPYPKGCNDDQVTFKGYMSRFLAYTAVLIPQTYERILPYLQASAVAAYKACEPTDLGSQCVFNWTAPGYDFSHPNMNQQLSVFEAIQVALVEPSLEIYSMNTGGNSTSFPDAGANPQSGYEEPMKVPKEATAADKGWAGFLTFLFSFVLVCIGGWLII